MTLGLVCPLHLKKTPKLQNDLDSVYRWANKNNMTFNIKFEILRYGANSELKKGKQNIWHLMVQKFKAKLTLRTWALQ